jgi:hypothetical protein
MDERQRSIDGIWVDFPPLRLAHSVVQWLRRWYAQHDIQVARTRLRAWLSRMKQANMPELTALASTIRRWRPWRVNFFYDRVTNGVTEGINTKIKLLKRMAYELSNFAHLRVRILMAFAQRQCHPHKPKLCQRTESFSECLYLNDLSSFRGTL